MKKDRDIISFFPFGKKVTITNFTIEHFPE